MFHIKKNTVKILLCLCSLFTFSQNSSCDGIRYIENSFHDIITTADVFFGSNTTIGGKSQDLFMDVFEPSNDTEDNRPLIILAFGGAFVSGNKEKMHDLANAYARKGYVTASIDYRLYDKLAIIDSALLIDVVVKGIGDMRAAVRYFKQDFSENGNTFGVDTNHIFVGGISSGGIIACHIGLLDAGDNIPEYLETSIENNGGWEGSSSDNTQYSSEVAGVLSFSGGIKEIEWVSEKDVPVFAVHETGDDVVPYQRGPVKINFGSLKNPKVKIIIEDASQFIKRNNFKNYFDLIIADRPDPIGPGKNLFKIKFYKDIKNALSNRGIAVFQNGVPFFQKKELKDTIKHLKSTFNYSGVYLTVVPTYIGGYMALTWSSNAIDISKKVNLDKHSKVINKLNTQYYTKEIHYTSFILPKWIKEI